MNKEQTTEVQEATNVHVLGTSIGGTTRAVTYANPYLAGSIVIAAQHQTDVGWQDDHVIMLSQGAVEELERLIPALSSAQKVL